MIFVEHRKNKISELNAVDINNGIEIDLRSVFDTAGKIHLAHDSWTVGDDFDSWLKAYSDLGIKGPLILNTKEDLLEERALELLKKYGVDNFLFLDTAMPTFIKWWKRGTGGRFFLRVSKHEDISSAIKFKGSVQWLWCDCFDRDPLPDSVLVEASSNFKLCLVSPELQGGSEDDFSKFLPSVNRFSAICTKKPQVWKEMIRGH